MLSSLTGFTSRKLLTTPGKHADDSHNAEPIITGVTHAERVPGLDMLPSPTGLRSQRPPARLTNYKRVAGERPRKP